MRNLYDPVGWRYPILRTTKEYVMALEGVHNGLDLDDIVDDIYKAFVSFYAGNLKFGPIENVGLLVREIKNKWKTVVGAGDFYKMCDCKIDVSDALAQMIEEKIVLSNGKCRYCSCFAVVCKDGLS